jgi:hypothetical protein
MKYQKRLVRLLSLLEDQIDDNTMMCVESFINNYEGSDWFDLATDVELLETFNNYFEFGLPEDD